MRTLGGRVLHINLAKDAATSGDVWLYGEKSGRRVRRPGHFAAPFLDTACPDGWKIALAQVAATPFKTAIPGHGAPMTQMQFLLYRQAFETFIDRANSATAEKICASRWASSVQPLLAPNSQEGQQTKGTAAYYVDMLRANGGRSKSARRSGRIPAAVCVNRYV